MLSDELLLKTLQKKPEKGLQMAMEKFSPLVYHIAQGKLKDVSSKEDIEELVSDVFIALYENRHKIEKGKIKAFLCTVTLNRAVDMFRRKTAFQTLELKEDIVSNERSLEEMFFSAQDKKELKNALMQLDDTDKAILARKIYLKQTSKEIAAAFGLSDDAVRKRISRAYEKLRENLSGVI